MAQDLVLKTDRLFLKVLDQGHANLVLEYFIRNRHFLKRWEPQRGDFFYTEECQKRLLISDLEGMRAGSMFKVWLLKEDDKSGKVIGSVSLNNIIRGCFLSCHMGYRLDKDEVNKGYMTEALKPVIDFAFTDLGLHRIEANIIPENAPSLRVVEKLGFEWEGLAKKYLKINGKWQDHVHMVLLNKALE